MRRSMRPRIFTHGTESPTSPRRGSCAQTRIGARTPCRLGPGWLGAAACPPTCRARLPARLPDTVAGLRGERRAGLMPMCQTGQTDGLFAVRDAVLPRTREGGMLHRHRRVVPSGAMSNGALFEKGVGCGGSSICQVKWQNYNNPLCMLGIVGICLLRRLRAAAAATAAAAAAAVAVAAAATYTGLFKSAGVYRC
eukprot:SAG22_NODE_1335_length_4700_cov_2.556183_2_plen_195_part_00